MEDPIGLSVFGLDYPYPLPYAIFMSKTQQLQIRAAMLPEHLASEVLDFLEFVATRHSGETPVRSQPASRYRGAFKGRLSSSTAFAEKKADEIRLEK
jgi:hypothetical protein